MLPASDIIIGQWKNMKKVSAEKYDMKIVLFQEDEYG